MRGYIDVNQCIKPYIHQIIALSTIIKSVGIYIMTIQEATDAVNISRSSFYKYKDDVLPFHENVRGKTINLMLQVDDTPGLLSKLLGQVAKIHANILTIHQTIPIGGIASITLGIEMLPQSAELQEMMDELKKTEGVHYIKILGRE